MFYEGCIEEIIKHAYIISVLCYKPNSGSQGKKKQPKILFSYVGEGKRNVYGR